ncbi:MAG TPA: hypothetical protein VHG31_06960 [Stellaceae bacterium]|nr:hypothetical protein [Stellaceae bacterium]
MRWAFAGLLAAAGLIITLSFGWSGFGWSGPASAPGSAVEESAWQLRELAFLKAAYDRMQQDMARPAEASASLHAGQERILRQMAETAKLLPSEAVPAELRALLLNAEAVPVSLSRLIETVAAEAMPPDLSDGRTPDLRVGLGGRPPPAVHDAEFAIDPELREPIRHQAAAERADRAPRRKPRDDAGRSGR